MKAYDLSCLLLRRCLAQKVGQVVEPHFGATSLTFAIQVLTFPRAAHTAVTAQAIACSKLRGLKLPSRCCKDADVAVMHLHTAASGHSAMQVPLYFSSDVLNL